MPRFLNTHTGEFVSITEIWTTPYAILSHTWRAEEEGGEQTFDDIVKLQAECPIATRKPWDAETAPPVNEAFFSHPRLSDKIKRACEVARNAGFRLIWIDSCCIDKRSSAELSEAINSMYVLYRDADVCFVFLADVRHGTDPRGWWSMFRRSRWHRRGWTLQELVAPSYVIFLTCDWTFLGTKTGLASTLEKITGVDAAILLGLKPVESASVARRMSWAAKRETTRVEDRAYSLLGIFGVHMSPIYGEGTNAFLRLQEEIIKHIPDQSIFAWGRSRTLLALDEVADEYRGPRRVWDSGLLAPSPNAFHAIGDVAAITPSEFTMRIGRTQDRVLPPLHCVFTPQGARIELMTIPLPPETAKMLSHAEAPDCDDCREAMACSPFRRLALLRCTDRDGHLIGLPLRCTEEDMGAAENVAIGVRAPCGAPWHVSPRVVRLSAAVLKDLDVAPACVEVSLLRHWKKPVQAKARRESFSNSGAYPLQVWQVVGTAPEIRLAPHCEEELRSVGFTLTPLESDLRQPEETRPTEFILTTTLSMHSTTQQPPHNDQHVSPPMLIELGLLRSATGGHLSVNRLHRPSAIELVHPASPAADDVSSGTPLHDESCHIPPTAGNPHHQSCSFDISLYSASSRTIAEAEFIIPDCTVSRTAAYGTSIYYVRLLRLKLEQLLESAYIGYSDHLSFSVELSEPFINNTASTDSEVEPAAVSPVLAQSDGLADSSPIQDAADPSPDSEGTPPSRLRHVATPNSPDLALSPTATSEQTAVCEGPGVPGACDAVMHDGPDIAHADGTHGTVPSPPQDTVQDTPEAPTALSPIAKFDETAVREGPPEPGTTSHSVPIGPQLLYIPVASTRLESLAAQGSSPSTSPDPDTLLHSVRSAPRELDDGPPPSDHPWLV